ncbi:MAG: restriction endonuclease subunit S, partial [bacterium]|nr:restriction endonuclease subunit S [bacterium]
MRTPCERPCRDRWYPARRRGRNARHASSCRRPYEKFADGRSVCIEDEIPFEIPDSWGWARLGQIVELISGRDLEPTEYNDEEEGMPYITGASCLAEDGVLLKRWTLRPSVVAHSGDLLLVCKGAGYGKTAFCDIPEAHIARQIMAMHSGKLLDLRYLRVHLIANIQSIKRFGQGLIPGIDRNTVLSILVPIPPFAEQKRIVAKIEELFSEADKIANAEDGIARTAERINKKILDLAIRGQLVPQDPNDEPADKLLERIRVSRTGLTGLKSDTPNPVNPVNPVEI